MELKDQVYFGAKQLKGDFPKVYGCIIKITHGF